ncbi:triphosphoribosyl-dephospho-CoA synthase [Sapientia aquatica]|uniref:Probable 2-(5''-triphosphoribosyl)-3'-dephosphocoenzyme-A synthase n=1 Tax=Sapientia aquatica TaxID=1549640 RepID=A0A4R5W629_9BURK|nr:triphosphoribosyl-dephospho-CoA synthase [Sapientia aquatica]TDK67526.1 triphosphoribosyl-dephospho-CoA synthase [Sapientia aquatica]
MLIIEHDIQLETVEPLSIDADAANQTAGKLAHYVVAALVDEATLTPKPGLVDMRSRGSHIDLSWSLMCESAYALHPTFAAMAHAGMTINNRQLLREKIGQLGREGEAWMMDVTGGVNTHRGAIWALGLLVTAAAQDLHDISPKAVAERAALLAQTKDQFAPVITGNKGEIACQQHGVGGAKLQAQRGFPLVVNVALPTLQQSRQSGLKESSARLNALLAVMTQLDDTCVLSRGGAAALALVQAGAQRVLDLGGVTTAFGKAAFNQLEANMLAQNVSSGGAADMLAAALFLDRLALDAKHLANEVN